MRSVEVDVDMVSQSDGEDATPPPPGSRPIQAQPPLPPPTLDPSVEEEIIHLQTQPS